jgi:very-short-patch-repair endonuclease
LIAGLLYAGPGAALAAQTAAWWFGLIPNEPTQIHLVTPRRVRSVEGLVITQAGVDRVWRRGLPTCSIERVLVDIAASVPEKRLRKAVSEALYRRLTSVAAIEAELKPGRAGSTAVRGALERHRDGVQRSRSELEEAFLLICERAGLPMPLVNQEIAGYELDIYWPEVRLAVEIDGPGHAENARMADDRERDMALRSAGIDVIRYTQGQIIKKRGAIASELKRELAKRRLAA